MKVEKTNSGNFSKPAKIKMTYLYLIYEKNSKSDIDLLVYFLQYVDYQKFPLNQNCKLTFKGNEIQLFILDELDYGISNQIYAIEKGEFFISPIGARDRISESKINFVDNDQVKTTRQKSKSGKLFYDSFQISFKSGSILEYLRVEEHDYESFARMVENSIVGYKGLNDKTAEIQVAKAFIKSGNFHKYLKIGASLSPVTHKAFMDFSMKGEYNECKDKDALFEELEKQSERRHATYAVEASLYYMDFSIDYNNFEKFTEMLDFSKKREDYFYLVSFLEEQLFAIEKKKKH